MRVSRASRITGGGYSCFFFFSVFFSTLHFQFHNALSCSFLVVLFIPLQTNASIVCSFLLLFISVKSYYLFLFNVITILLFFFSLFFFTLHFQLHNVFLVRFCSVVHSSPTYIALIACSFFNCVVVHSCVKFFSFSFLLIVLV